MAILGLLSDSHGRAATTDRAAKLLVERGAEVLIHLGDVGTEAVIEALVQGLSPTGGPSPPVHLVFGNTDWNAPELGRFAAALGMQVAHPAGRLTLAGKVIAFTHGHDSALMQEALSDGVDYLLHGHTHKPLDQRRGRTRIINPGALYRASKHTAALLDVANDQLTFIDVEEGDRGDRR